MLKRTFDAQKRYRVVLYLRMSSDKQNPRSPDQQEAEIRQRLKAAGYQWVIVKVYRDDAKSGRYLRKRLGYQKMLQDIKTGVVQVDLILVDTLERFGRVDELSAIRKDLYERHGVLILTADSNFADPTTPQGKAFGAFEAMRATEEGRVKAHQVRRGKRDLAQRGYWPGGPRPFGYKLVGRTIEHNGREVLEGSVLDPFPEEDWIIQMLFERAHATEEGQTLLARFLNNHPDIPRKFKPFSGATVGYWLDQEIYYGELVWDEHSTGVVNDARRVERNAEDEMLRLPNFCTPLVSRELWEAVQAVREVRRKSRKQADADGKQIMPLAPGMTLSHLLSGLVRCGECRASMRPVTSGRKSKAGKSYAYYACPRAIDGHCGNKKYVSEEWLQGVVIDHIKQRLFPQS
jgi:DNA invertase Pin-like site-specific DNA recombinase